MKENKRIIEWLLLGTIAISGVVTAWQIREVVKEGLEITLSVEQADELAAQVQEAREAAMNDMNEEGE